jgi:hypothetical protein
MIFGGASDNKILKCVAFDKRGATDGSALDAIAEPYRHLPAQDSCQPELPAAA